MDLKKYFDNTEGDVVLATSDSEGKVNVAVYSRPHVMEDGTLALIMADRLTRKNLESNPHAALLFLERGGGYNGMRLHLTKVREEGDGELLQSLRRRKYPPDTERSMGDLKLLFFRVDKQLPLVGA